MYSGKLVIMAGDIGDNIIEIAKCGIVVGPNDSDAILKAIELGFSKVLYVDIDAHHCDGVQDVFLNNENVTIISIHEKNRWPQNFVPDAGSRIHKCDYDC